MMEIEEIIELVRLKGIEITEKQAFYILDAAGKVCLALYGTETSVSIEYSIRMIVGLIKS